MKKRDTDTYVINVRFERSKSDDIEVARQKYKTESDLQALIFQFRDELQQACNDGIVAGQFKIITEKRKRRKA